MILKSIQKLEIRNWRSRYRCRHVIIDKRKYNSYFYPNPNDQSILKYLVNFIPGTRGNIKKILVLSVNISNSLRNISFHSHRHPEFFVCIEQNYSRETRNEVFFNISRSFYLQKFNIGMKRSKQLSIFRMLQVIPCSDKGVN